MKTVHRDIHGPAGACDPDAPRNLGRFRTAIHGMRFPSPALLTGTS